MKSHSECTASGDIGDLHVDRDSDMQTSLRLRLRFFGCVFFSYSYCPGCFSGRERNPVKSGKVLRACPVAGP